MKRYALFMVVMLAIVPALASAQATSDMEIILIDQNPSPAEPGANVIIGVSFWNDGYRESSAIAIEIIPTGPFSLVKGDKIRTFSRIGPQDSFQLT